MQSKNEPREITRKLETISRYDICDSDLDTAINFLVAIRAKYAGKKIMLDPSLKWDGDTDVDVKEVRLETPEEVIKRLDTTEKDKIARLRQYELLKAEFDPAPPKPSLFPIRWANKL